jgi:hypothetical protein
MRAFLAIFGALLLQPHLNAVAEPQFTTIEASNVWSYRICDTCSHFPYVYSQQNVHSFSIGNGEGGIVAFDIPEEVRPIKTARLTLHSHTIDPDEFEPINVYGFDGSLGWYAQSELSSENLIGVWWLYQNAQGLDYSVDVSDFVRNASDPFVSFTLTEATGINSFYWGRLTVTTVPEPSTIWLSLFGLVGPFTRTPARHNKLGCRSIRQL